MRAFSSLPLLLLVACNQADGTNGHDLAPLPPDMASPADLLGAFGAACNVVAQTGCNSGLHCTIGKLGGAGADVCVTTPPRTIDTWGSCAPISYGTVVGDYCKPGTACVSYHGGGGLCRPLCYAHADCPSGSLCAVPTDSPSMNMDGTSLGACLVPDNCEPIRQTGCAAGTGCYFVRDDVLRAGVCDSMPGTLPPGSSCVRHIDCAPSNLCSSPTVGFCRKLCYLPGPAADGAGACPIEQTCNTLFGISGFGYCE